MDNMKGIPPIKTCSTNPKGLLLDQYYRELWTIRPAKQKIESNKAVATTV